MLAVCAGLQILGVSFVGPDGVEADGLGLVDCVTRRGRGPRAVGEIVVEPVAGLGLPTLSGYENHAGVTSVGPGAPPAGRVRQGVGNGDGSRTDGVWAGRVVGTYLHGPVLARNPALADHLLGWVVGDLAPLDDTEQQALRAERLAALGPTARRRPARRVAPSRIRRVGCRRPADELHRPADRPLRADHARRRPAGGGCRREPATFEVFTRRLPPGRRAGVFAGLGRLLDALGVVPVRPGRAGVAGRSGGRRPATLDWLGRFCVRG